MFDAVQMVERIRQFAKKVYLFSSGQTRRVWYDDAPALHHWGLYGSINQGSTSNAFPEIVDGLSDGGLSEDSVRHSSFERDSLISH